MWFFVFYFVFSVLVGIYARRIQRGEVAWFFLSLIISPLIAFLLLIAAGVPKRSLKKCPKCAEEVKAEAQVCRFCGHTFAQDALPAIPDPVSPGARERDTEVRDLAVDYINRVSKKS